MIDLHSHTTASDGQHSPEELFAMAARAKVTHLAVTDHDTVAGLERAEKAAAEQGVVLVPGIELSATVNGREVHVLGHFIQRGHPALGEIAGFLRSEREKRMHDMIARLNALGIGVTYEQVLRVAGDANLGRPHLALALVDSGVVLDTKEAFDRYLGRGRPACVDRHRMTGAEAVKLVRDAGGTATVAHPGPSKLEQHELAALATAGLAGLEVDHADHPPHMREKYGKIAMALDLVPTAGSDFHGERVAPGRKLGDASMKPESFERLRARAANPA